MSRLPPLTLEEAPHSIPSGSFLVRAIGQEHFFRQGNLRSAELELTSEELEERDRQSGIRGIQKKYQIDRGGTLNATLLQDTAFSRRTSLMAPDGETLPDQAAEVGVTIAYATAIKGGTYPLGEKVLGKLIRKRVVTNVVVTNAAGTTTYDAGTDYTVNADIGVVTLLNVPVGAGLGLVITFDCAAVTDRPLYRVWGASEVEVDVLIVQDMFVGIPYEYRLPRIEFKKSGAFPLIVENTELMANELEGTLYVDNTQEPGFELGYATPILGA